MSKTALICGVGGQDGSYLAKFLLQKGYRVIGTSRNPSPEGVANLSKLGIAQQVECIPMEAADSLSVTSAIAFSKPDEVYYLAGESSVAKSFLNPASSFQNIALVMIYFLPLSELKKRRP
jgi:GDPmannose 4,6-dehydratase